MVENRDVWRLWSHAKGQWRTSMAGIVGIDMGAVMAIARELDIDMTPNTLKKIGELETCMLKWARKAGTNGKQH